MGNAEGKRAQKAPHVSHFSNSCPELNRICFFFFFLFNSINNSEISEIFPHVDSCRGKLAEGGEGRTNSDQNLTHSWKNPLGKKKTTLGKTLCSCYLVLVGSAVRVAGASAPNPR